MLKAKPKSFPNSILITGASSGIGAALAEQYAKAGVTLFLSGRNEERLAEVRRRCEAKGAKVYPHLVDVLDQTGMRIWIERADDITPLELVVANAGISAGTAGGEGETMAQAQALFATNVYGVLNTVYPALERMQKRGQGQIALMSSLAGFYGFPGAPAYCASKAAVRCLGEAWRAQFYTQGIKVNVICPGYVDTAMTKVNDFPMPLMMSSKMAARHIYYGLAVNKARISFPWMMRFAIWIIFNMPSPWIDRILSRLPGKQAL